MANTLKDVFQTHTDNVRITPALLADLRAFENAFVNYNEDHIAFFGGNLLGVHPMRFRQTDYNSWFDDVLVIDDLSLQDDVFNLPSINRTHKVGPNVFNLSSVWLMHKFLTAPTLSEKQREEGAVLVALILSYKYLGSILSWFFPYPADEALAVATYRSLSRKFSIKEHGSWKKLLVARAQELVSDRSIHAKTLRKFDNDDRILYVVTDVYTRLKQLIKDMNEVFYQVRASEMRISSSNPLAESDGEKLIRDVINKERTYIRYIQSVIHDKTSFIKDELVETTLEMMHTASEKHLRDTLTYLINNTKGRIGRDIDTLTQELIVYSMNYVSTHRDTIPNPRDIMSVVLRLRGVFMASKNTEESVVYVRRTAEKLAKLATGSQNPNTLSSIRTSLIIYLLLRTLAKDHYG